MSVWHDGHIMGGYQNPVCPGCQREERSRLLAMNGQLRRLRRQAVEQKFSAEFTAGYLSAIDDVAALYARLKEATE